MTSGLGNLLPPATDDLAGTGIRFKVGGKLRALVIGCLAEQHGVIDIMSRGMREIFERATGGSPQYKAAIIARFTAEQSAAAPGVKAILEGGVTGQLGKLSIGSAVHPKVEVDLVLLAQELLNNFAATLTSQAAHRSLLVVAFEMLKPEAVEPRPKVRPDLGPVMEFLRHCRNGAAHNGIIEFRGKEPLYTAEWQGLPITATDAGRPLFNNGMGNNGVIYSGDVIHLLSDIDATIPD